MRYILYAANNLLQADKSLTAGRFSEGSIILFDSMLVGRFCSDQHYHGINAQYLCHTATRFKLHLLKMLQVK